VPRDRFGKSGGFGRLGDRARGETVTVSTSEDHEGLAEELEQEARRLKEETERLEGEISDVRTDWESKRQDPAVPGAPEPRREDDPDAEENPKDRDIEPG
jgi:predicted nuclease with TOPRIM domain